MVRLRFAALFAAAMAACGICLRAQDATPKRRADFMRQKLELSKNLMEGLTREDFALISRNARALKNLSNSEQWRVSAIPNADEYLAYTAEFRRISDDLMKATEQRNLDGATLAFTRMTFNCIGCHKYVRAVVP